MKYRLGLDLGTNSLGWAILGLDDDNTITGNIIDMGVRIFSDGRVPKTGEPLAIERRNARSIRRNIYRKKIRRYRLFKLLQSQGLFPLDKSDAQCIKCMNPYELRVKALDSKLNPYELGRVLFNLGVRRGFKSNRKDLTESDNDISAQNKQIVVKDPLKMSQNDKCAHLEKTVKDSGYRTLGEYLWCEKDTNKGLRFVADRTTFYPTRKLYEQEFEAIKNKQIQFYPDLCWDDIHNKIFNQRPLKRPDRGTCQFDITKPRTYKAMPCSCQFRILQDVNNLVWYGNSNTRHELEREEQIKLIEALNNSKEVSFDKMRKILKLENVRFNLEELRDKLIGNPTAVILRNKSRFGPLWDTLPLKQQDEIVETLITAVDDEEVYKVLEPYTVLSDELKKNVVHTVLPSGTTSICKEITEQLVEVMSAEPKRFDEALAQLGYSHSEELIEHYDLLPYYGQVLTGSVMGGSNDSCEKSLEKRFGKIANPTVHIALNQLRLIVNSIIKVYGKPAQIVVEVSKDLKNSREQKRKINAFITTRTKDNERINKNITELCPNIVYPNRDDRLKFRLWEELGENSMARLCPYCGKNISASEIFSSNIEIEHILPYSRTLLNNESNLTVAHTKCNEKKGERTPYEAFGGESTGIYAWDGILLRSHHFKNKAKQSKFDVDAMEKFEKSASFIERQLTDNAYLSKIARKYLTSITDKKTDVWTVAGGMTKLLRDRWEIDSILKKRITEKEAAEFNIDEKLIGDFKKNRYDHRHHALDALVIGLSDRSMVQQVAICNSKRHTDKIAIPACPVSRLSLQDKVKNIVPSLKPDHGAEGKLSKETLLGHIKLENAISINDLVSEDIENIKIDSVKQEIKDLLQTNSLSNTKKILCDKYPVIKVYKYQFVTRMALVSIKEKNIGDIIDTTIRNKLQTYISEHADTKYEQNLVDFSNITGIRRLRCATFAQSPIVIPADKKNPLSVPRYYNPEEYYNAVVWQIPSDKKGERPVYKATFVLKINAKKEVEKPHPAAKKICEVFKGDYLELSINGQWVKAVVAGYSATNGKFDIQPVFASKDIYSWLASTNDYFTEKYWKPNKGHNFVSVNVLFGIQDARPVNVNPLGKTCCKK